MRADTDAYCVLDEKTSETPWSPPGDYTIEPDPASRFFDPTPIDDPVLPPPAPQLYAYQLPSLADRDGSALAQGVPTRHLQTTALTTATMLSVPGQRPENGLRRLPRVSGELPVPPGGVRTVLATSPSGTAVTHAALHWSDDPAADVPDPHAFDDGPLGQLPPPADQRRDDVSPVYGSAVRLTAIPPQAWEAIPPSCQLRMSEFESLVEELQRTERAFGQVVAAAERDAAERLSLEDIVQLALINSRDYQTQKEILYRVALRLSLERFDYDLKFTPNGHRTSVDFSHNRVAAVTENSLGVPTTFEVNKMLLTGGDLLARFANSVVLTFSGPAGFAADVGSDLFMEISQTIFQRDGRFESLTQAERDVVYAARDFARFRKELFAQLANEYYALIRTYRQVEIDSQNYFTLVRAFHQSEAEFRAGQIPRFQVDQVEQNVLSGRSRLIQTCNNLEAALDNLKLRIGLPTETPINIDLVELNQITSRDQLAVAGELIRRARRRLETERTNVVPDRGVLLSSSIVLIDRVFAALPPDGRPGDAPLDTAALRTLQAEMQVDSARLTVEEVQAELEEEQRSASPSLPIIFQRSRDLIDSQLELIGRQLQLAERHDVDARAVEEFRRQAEQIRMETNELSSELQRIIDQEQLGELPQAVAQADAVRRRAARLVQSLDQQLGIEGQAPGRKDRLDQTTAQVDMLLELSDQVLEGFHIGLTPIDVDADDAMLTALVLGLDLITERGLLADDWRQIKLAADDLRSVLNLSASQTVSTRADVNRPFDFTFEESRTEAKLEFDAPLNRRAQRNAYRNTLIDYHAALRQLMELEDVRKLAVRNDLRDLALGREQYSIDVASAALAFERVVSTELEFRLGVGGAATRDFLEAQDAYTGALSRVAGRHIDYILDRMQLFLDMELLTVDETGFWPELYDEQIQPEPYLVIPPYAAQAYGQLPCVWYSSDIQRMLDIPPGTPAIHRAPSE